MNTEDVLEEFRASGALREGHFVLSSGLHSGTFLQKNLVFQYPERTARLCKALAEKIKEAVERSFKNPFASLTKDATGLIPSDNSQAVRSVNSSNQCQKPRSRLSQVGEARHSCPSCSSKRAASARSRRR